MKYAVIKTGGKQCKVSEGEEIFVEKLSGKKGDLVVFDQALLLVDDRKIDIGQPLVEKARVKAKILEQVKGKKIRIAKFKAKSRYRRVRGYRQRLTKVKIERIDGQGKN